MALRNRLIGSREQKYPGAALHRKANLRRDFLRPGVFWSKFAPDIILPVVKALKTLKNDR